MVLFRLSLRGLGFYNYQTKHLTGEYYFITRIFNNRGKKIIFDVGAHIGNYSIDLSTNPEAEIYSFEASPVTFKILQKKTHNIKNIMPLNFAVSDTITTLKFYDYDDREFSQHASLYKDVIVDYHKGHAKEFDVKTTTIDNFTLNFKINKIDLLKIDVEGHELKVLIGAQHMLQTKSIQAIQFEFTQLNSITRVFFKDIYELLNKNYNLYRLLPTGLLRIKSYTPTECEIFGYSNYIGLLKDEMS
jgi:FkbM family methyltransferase